MKSDIPLTPEQRIFASENYALVFKFLNENHLDEAEYFDIVIFGYLRSVVRYFTEPDLRKYAFSTIAWQAMFSELANHKRKLEHRLSEDDLISLSLLADDETARNELLETAQNLIMAKMKGDLLLYDLARAVSQRQMNVVLLKSEGYNARDISHRQKMPIRQVLSLLAEAHELLRVLCYE